MSIYAGMKQQRALNEQRADKELVRGREEKNYLRQQELQKRNDTDYTRKDAEYTRGEENRNWFSANPNATPDEMHSRGMFDRAEKQRTDNQATRLKQFDALSRIAGSVKDQQSYTNALSTVEKVYGKLPSDIPTQWDQNNMDMFKAILEKQKSAANLQLKSYDDARGNKVTSIFDPATGEMKPVSTTPRNYLHAPDKVDQVSARQIAKEERMDADRNREIMQARQKYPGLKQTDAVKSMSKTVKDKFGKDAPNPDYNPSMEADFKAGNQRMTGKDREFDMNAESTGIRASLGGKPPTREQLSAKAQELGKMGYSQPEIRQMLINAGVKIR